MARRLDITDRLSFEENPILVVRGEELEVNQDAPTMLKVMGMMGSGEVGPEKVLEAYSLIFPEESQKKIEKMKPNFQDLMVLVEAAVEMIVGGEKNARE
ncbi:MAG: hypothetical protein Q4E24_14035 [bacterium]|nr:hypothetical protein [bacterium]